MKKVFVLAFALVLSAPVLTMAQVSTVAPATEKKSGAILTPTESRYEFGTITQGDVVDHNFAFRNTGTEPLVITNVGVSCGCTTPEWTKEPIMPGKTGNIHARFNSTGKMGVQNKVLTVNSNNGAGDVMLTLAGTVNAKEETAAAASAATTLSAAPVATATTKATPIEKGKIKVKKAKGEKAKVKIEDGKVEVKK